MLPALILIAVSAQAFEFNNDGRQDINAVDYPEENDRLSQKKPSMPGVSANSLKPCQEYYGTIPYKRTPLLTIKGLPTNLAVDPRRKDLYFTLIDETSFENDTQTRMEQFVFKNGKAIKLDHIRGQAAAVDPVTSKVYIGTEDGLKTLNNALRAESHSFPNEDIVQLVKAKKKYLYAIIYPNNEVHKLDIENNEKIRIPNVPCSDILAVDEDENIYFSNQHRKLAHVLLKGFQEPIEYAGIPENAIKAMNVDSKGRVILAANDGLYRLDPQNIIPKKLMNLDFVPSGLAIDQYDIYVASRNIIYRYRPFVCTHDHDLV